MVKYIINQWYTLSIKSKLLIFFTAVILSVSLVHIYTQYNSYQFMDKFNNNLESYFEINSLLMNLRDNKQHIQKYLKEMNKEDLQTYRKSVDEIETMVAQIEKEHDTLETYFLINAIKRSLAAYYSECENAINIRKDKGKDYYLHLYKATHISDYTEQYIQQLLYVSLSEGSWFYKKLVEEAKILKTITFIIILAILLLCLGFGLMFSNYLTGPIKKLAAASIEIAEGNLDVKGIQVKPKDEVGILAHSFNKMSASIKQLVTDLKQKALIEKKLHAEELENIRMQQLLKEAEFKALQSQINPHFLFNTLNTIARTSMFEHAPNTTKLIQSLSNLLRYNLRSQDEYVTLAKEIEIVQEYTYLQKYRFQDRLKVEIECGVNPEKVIIPSFTLQPLVENAIIHGIEPKIHGGTIRIKVNQKGNTIVIKIIDNGIGMSKRKIQALLQGSDQQYGGHTTGIGIINVLQRLKLYFQGYEQFKITSKEGLGTKIEIILPIQKECNTVV